LKRPNFFIIGAPKCGTSSLAAWLGEHPQAFMSEPKEPSFFDTDNELGVAKTLTQYLRIFENAKDDHLAVGEASVGYLFSQVAVRNIIEFNPSAKFIVLLRNPLEMVVSLHGEMYWAGWECIEDFETAWRVRNVRGFGRGQVGPFCSDLRFIQYENACKLGEQVDRLLKTVDAKSVLFIFLEDIKLSPSHEYRRVLDFLEVPYDGKSEFTVHNPSKRERNQLIRHARLYFHIIKRKLGIPFPPMRMLKAIFVSKYKSPPLRAEFRQELIEVYRDDVMLLSSLLGRDLSHWLR